MKRAIVCYVDGDVYEEQFELTKSNIKAYALRCGAELVVLNGRTEKLRGETDKFQAESVFSEFDMSLFLDVDVVVQRFRDSIFDIVPNDRVSGFNELPHIYYKPFFSKCCPYKYVAKSQRINIDSLYFVMNSGVFTIPRDLAYLYRYPDHPIEETTRCMEQTIFSCRLQEAGLYNPIDETWNLSFNSPNFNRMRNSANFVHFNFRPMDKRLEEIRKQLRR